ncbi:MAG: DUF308 domain-containing protein [Candidatus Limisoma sp.]
MKKWISILINSLVFLTGLILVMLNSRSKVLETVVVIFGILIIVPSLITIISIFTKKIATQYGLLALLPSVGSLILGIVLVTNPSMFVSLLVYIFAAILLLLGVYDLWRLIAANEGVRFAPAFYVVPILLIVGGIVLLAVDVETVESVLVLIAGIGLMLCGINSLVQMFLTAKAPCDSDKAAEKANVVDITADASSKPESKTDSK